MPDENKGQKEHLEHRESHQNWVAAGPLDALCGDSEGRSPHKPSGQDPGRKAESVR